MRGELRQAPHSWGLQGACPVESQDMEQPPQEWGAFSIRRWLAAHSRSLELCLLMTEPLSTLATWTPGVGYLEASSGA